MQVRILLSVLADRVKTCECELGLAELYYRSCVRDAEAVPEYAEVREVQKAASEFAEKIGALDFARNDLNKASAAAA